MSTFFGIVFALIFGGWIVATIFRLGVFTLIGIAGAIILGLIYGVIQIVFEIPWNDDFVLFWSVYGLIGVLCLGYCLANFNNNFLRRGKNELSH